LNDPLLFGLAVAAILATPGPTNTLMATAGATQGFARSLRLLAAEISGYLVAILIYWLVLGPLVSASPMIATGLKVAVALYLVWLAIKLWRRPIILDATEGTVSFANVFITTVLNPKALVFALTIFPHTSAGIGWYLAGFTGLVILAGSGWIALGGLIRRAPGTVAAYVPKIASVVLVAFAGVLLRSVV
jgi:threonine/homoserine/homoserine lactone efflux protein